MRRAVVIGRVGGYEEGWVMRRALVIREAGIMRMAVVMRRDGLCGGLRHHQPPGKAKELPLSTGRWSRLWREIEPARTML